MSAHRQHFHAANRLRPPQPLPHPMQQQMDAHESLYWTCIAIGAAGGFLVGVCFGKFL